MNKSKINVVKTKSSRGGGIMAFGLLKKVGAAAFAVGIVATAGWAQGGRVPSDALAQLVRPVGGTKDVVVCSVKRGASASSVPGKTLEGDIGGVKFVSSAVRDKTVVW